MTKKTDENIHFEKTRLEDKEDATTPEHAAKTLIEDSVHSQQHLTDLERGFNDLSEATQVDNSIAQASLHTSSHALHEMPSLDSTAAPTKGEKSKPQYARDFQHPLDDFNQPSQDFLYEKSWQQRVHRAIDHIGKDISAGIRVFTRTFYRSDPDKSTETFIHKFAAVLLVSVLFLTWVIIDRAIRPAINPQTVQVNRLLIEALEALKDGQFKVSEDRIVEASKLETDPKTAMRIQQIIVSK